MNRRSHSTSRTRPKALPWSPSLPRSPVRLTSGAVLVEFRADECRASRTAQAALEGLTARRPGLRLVTIDAWDAPGELIRWRVLSLPTVILLVDGSERARCTGPNGSEGLARRVECWLGP